MNGNSFPDRYFKRGIFVFQTKVLLTVENLDFSPAVYKHPSEKPRFFISTQKILLFKTVLRSKLPPEVSRKFIATLGNVFVQTSILLREHDVYIIRGGT